MMKGYRPWLALLSLVAIAVAIPACSSSEAIDGNAKVEAKKPARSSAPAQADDKAAPLLEPYDPPALAEIDATAEWIDQPVVDAYKALQAKQQKESPLATPAEALRLKNDSPAANQKILSALGRLPEKESDADWNGTFNRHMRSDVRSTNPLLQSSVEEFDVSQLTGISLLTFDWNMKAFGDADVIESWQTSKDRLIDKIVLRKDLSWSDGKPFTAHDVVFSFKTIMNPKVPVPSARSGTDELRWVEAYDDQTVVFFHKEALATNPWNILFPIIAKHIYEKTIQDDLTLQTSPAHVKLEYEPVTSGPYVIVSRTRGQEIVLERRDAWFMQDGQQVRRKPFFKTIRFRIKEDPNTTLLALKSGQIDEMMLRAEQWQSQTSGNDFYANNTKVTDSEWLYFYFGWNNKSPFFEDRRVREAMSYAFDYREMLDKLFYGLYQPSNGLFHPTAWMASKNAGPPYKQDLDKAEELLDAAGWIDHDDDGIRDKMIGGRLVPFEFSLVVKQDPERIRVCELLKQNLDQIGIVCNITPLEATVLQERMFKKEFQAAFGGWSTGTDPDTSENVWGTGEARNFLNYSNPEVDKLYAQGRTEFDPEKRAKIYGRIHELIYKDQPATFLYFQNSFYGFNKNLRGYVFSPRGPYHYSPGVMSIWKAL